MKLSDWVMAFLVRQGVKTAFGLPGGGAMHLIDSIGRNEELQFVNTLHEQAASFAAEGYANFTGLGVCLVTSGPGGTNAVTGCAGAYCNSSPVLFISGQVGTGDIKSDDQRFNGVQEIDIIEIVRPITKYARRLMFADNAMATFGIAVHEAISQRQGPVWVDIPLDVQAQDCPCEIRQVIPYSYHDDFDLEMVMDYIIEAKKKIVLFGHGAAIYREDVRNFVHKFRALHPMLTWRAIDLFDAPRPGMLASEGANKELQSADLVICIGARMDKETVAYRYDNFAPKAVKIVVDIDRSELDKLPENSSWIKICTDAGYFMRKMLGD